MSRWTGHNVCLPFPLRKSQFAVSTSLLEWLMVLLNSCFVVSQ